MLGIREGAVRDICKTLEKHGIIIVELDIANDSFDGVSFITDKGHTVIVINKNRSNDRKRFTIAHELGHIIMHLCESFIIPEYRNREEEADAFASEFLMPEGEIKNSLRNIRLSDLISLKQIWLTSIASLIRRAKDLELITTQKYTYFNIELSRLGYKKKEPFEVYIDKPTLFSDNYTLHKVDLGYTDGELADSFYLPIDVINRFCTPKEGKLRVLFSRKSL